MQEDADFKEKAELFLRHRIQREIFQQLRRKCYQSTRIRRLAGQREGREKNSLGRRCWARWRVLFVARLMSRRNQNVSKLRTK